MQIADWISHPGSSTPIHYLNAKVNAFISSAGMVLPARPPPGGLQAGVPGQPWQGREGSHPLCRGANSTPGDKVQRLSGRVAPGTWDLSLHPPLCSSLVLWPHGPAVAACHGRWAASSLRKRLCVFWRRNPDPHGSVRAFLLLTTASSRSRLPLSPARDSLVGFQC